MELLGDSGHVQESRLSRIKSEGEEILRITVTSIATARGNLRVRGPSSRLSKSAICNPQSAME
jgi:hypothetical protein